MTAWHPAGHASCLARLPPLNLDLIWASLGLVVVLLIGYLVVSFLRGRMRGEAPDSSEVGPMNFRELYQRGEISKEEYERILLRTGQRSLPTPSMPEASTALQTEQKLPAESPASDVMTPGERPKPPLSG